MSRELLFRLTRKDFVVEAFRGSGAGGQNRNVTNSACRITHPPSGGVGSAQDERSYKRNESLAFRRLIESKKFKAWHSMECSRRMGLLKNIDESVEAEMKRIKIEVRDEHGRWIEEKPASSGGEGR